MEQSRSIVEWFGGGDRGHRCGYCKSPDSNMSDGMWAHTMTTQDYQDLIDRGWRRSGKYCYKPNMKKMCCPHYTIRCEALNFHMSKSHKKIIKQFNRYIIQGIKKGEKSQQPSDSNSKDSSSVMEDRSTPISSTADDDPKPKKVKAPPKPGIGADPSKPICKKAKEIRKERSTAKQKETQGEKTHQKEKSQEKTLEDFLNEYKSAENCAHTFEMRLVRVNPMSNDYKKTYKESYKVFKCYQMSIHKEKESDCDESTYRDFLVEGPLQEEYKDGGLPMGYGSFHQHYILDGNIIAVGVIDILPLCVSSVYLYYDPDYDFLSLGTYSALQELAFTRSLSKIDNDLKFYYMGYYIHSCPKMKYKGQYVPSYLLCPETYMFCPIDECTPKLDANRYSRFSAETKDDGENQNTDEVGILFTRHAINYEIYKTFRKGRADDDVEKYIKLTGINCAKRMLLYRS